MSADADAASQALTQPPASPTEASSSSAASASSSSSSSSGDGAAAAAPSEAKRGKGSKGAAGPGRKKPPLKEKNAKRCISRPAAKRLFDLVGRPTSTKGEKLIPMRLTRLATDAFRDTLGLWIKRLSHEATRRAKRQGRMTVFGIDVYYALLGINKLTTIFPRADASVPDADLAPPVLSASAPSAAADSGAPAAADSAMSA